MKDQEPAAIGGFQKMGAHYPVPLSVQGMNVTSAGMPAFNAPSVFGAVILMA